MVSEKPTLKEKLTECGHTLNKIVFGAVSASLFKADRLTFALHFARSIYPALIPQIEWEIFLGQKVASSAKVTTPSWLPPDRE